MQSPIRISRNQRPSLLVLLATLLSLLLVACGGQAAPTTTSTAKQDVTAPNDLKTAGTLLVGSDTTYTPMEYIDTQNNQAAGFDVELIQAMAKHMGITAKVQTANFDTIIDDLRNKRFDTVISSVTINSDRQKVVDFVPYFKAGESLLVKKGNPKSIKGVTDLCGVNVGVQTGTTEQADLNTADKDCKSKGKPAINLTVLQSQTEVVQLLANGRVEATYQDSPVTDYYNKINPGQFEVGGSIVNSAPYGIVVRKGDAAMLKALQDAFKAVQADGTYQKLFDKYGFSSAAKI